MRSLIINDKRIDLDYLQDSLENPKQRKTPNQTLLSCSMDEFIGELLNEGRAQDEIRIQVL